jgi:hypothetical protein
MRFLPALVLLTGCLSGQTGSPDCVPRKACVCDPMYGAGTQLRVHVESQGDGQLRAVVDEIFPSTYGTNGLVVGDHIGGSVNVSRPCAPAAPLEAADGSELFVLFSPGTDGQYPNCAAFQSCASSQCEKLVEPALTDCWSGCDQQTRATCDASRQAALLDGYYGWAIPWTDPLSFGGGNELPRSDLSVLASDQQCRQRFPADPAPPCQDTQTFDCAAAPNDRGSGGAAWLAGLLAALVVASRARRQRE